MAPKTRRYFFIRSRLNDHCLDVRGSNTDPGAEVITFHHHGADNQLFYVHSKTGTIRSKLNDFCLDFENELLVLNPYEKSKSTQKWKLKDSKIQNRKEPEQVFDIQGSNEDEGASVCMYAHHGGDNQRWYFEYHYQTEDPGPSSYEDSD